MMRFYTKQHPFYCGIDLHARLLAICILDSAGAVVLQTQIPADKQLLLKTLAPFRPDVVVAVECLLVRHFPAVKIWQARHEKKHGKKKTLGILAARLGRTVYHMLRKREAFDVKRFLGQ